MCLVKHVFQIEDIYIYISNQPQPKMLFIKQFKPQPIKLLQYQTHLKRAIAL
jgi:hypothetical protein